MFEKEAEERARDIYTNFFGDIVAYPEILKAITVGVLKGAEFGYNKAKEWHYVKDELPPENVPLNIITFDKNKKRRLWGGEYKGGNGQWWTGYFNHFIDVPYAWKEIVLPELKEDEIESEMFPEIILPEGSSEFIDKVIADAEKRVKEIE